MNDDGSAGRQWHRILTHLQSLADAEGAITIACGPKAYTSRKDRAYLCAAVGSAAPSWRRPTRT
ncbi:hypothetical protein San01_50420 [Streptomyces angustmyceticus]|uniref:Uncharacterized protein n=1 Tax=Streptomyces angustmyceticus TaxID=285578 RepID=A0A5J4LQA4_9ACTN|nr:hypothetical protein San01_50420 [Streptomyces angustmyceticus]